MRIGGNLLFTESVSAKARNICRVALVFAHSAPENVANEVYVLNAGQSLVQHVVVADVSDMLFGF